MEVAGRKEEFKQIEEEVEKVASKRIGLSKKGRKKRRGAWRVS
jgi:hypothetical protein